MAPLLTHSVRAATSSRPESRYSAVVGSVSLSRHDVIDSPFHFGPRLGRVRLHIDHRLLRPATS